MTTKELVKTRNELRIKLKVSDRFELNERFNNWDFTPEQEPEAYRLDRLEFLTAESK